MTMLLKQGAKAVESNEVLKALSKVEPLLLKGVDRNKRVIGLGVSYGESKVMYVINRGFEVEAVTGNNVTHGRR